jgi:serine O-acetyltransferase
MSKLRADIERFYSLRGIHVPLTTLQLSMACLNPRVLPVFLLRFAEWSDKHGLGPFAKVFAMLNVLIFGIEVSPKVKIGGGLFLPHTVGTVIGAERIGSNCTIMQGVTLGSAEPDLNFTATTRPVIGDDVLIGAGAKVIGRVTVGDHAKIGANAVVLKDVPAHSLAVGVPATVKALGDIDG